MEFCDVCGQIKDTSDLTATYVISKQEQRKNIHICKACVNYVCDVPKGAWFPLKSTDEVVKLPGAFYVKL